MKTIIYFLLTIIGFIGSVVGTVKLGSFGVDADATVIYHVLYTLVSMGIFTFFGYALKQSYKEFVKKLKD